MKRRSNRQYRRRCNTTHKVRYPSREEAMRCGQVLIMLGKWLGKQPYAYHCGDCGKWHLTKMKQPNGE